MIPPLQLGVSPPPLYSGDAASAFKINQNQKEPSLKGTMGGIKLPSLIPVFSHGSL